MQSEPSTTFHQRYDYKRLPPEATDKEIAKQYWDTTPAIQDIPINSVIAEPQNGDTVKLPPSGKIEIKGYALPYGDQGPVVKVECSIDGGQTWEAAEIFSGNSIKAKWSWALWKATVRLPKGKNRRILSRATDQGGNVQSGEPVRWKFCIHLIKTAGRSDYSQAWNLRGFIYDGYGECRDLNVV